MTTTVRDPREVIAQEPMHRRQLVAIAIATALNALDGFDVLAISFASPGIVARWGIDRAALGVVLSMELIGMAIGALALGSAADRVGRRPTILGCLVVMALGMALASIAPTLIFLSLVRLFTGLGIGGMLASTNAVVAECSNARRRELFVALMAGGYPMGAVVGGVVSSQLLATTGRWESIFVFGAISTAAFVPLVLWLVPETVAFLCSRRPADALVRINHTMTRLGRAPLSALPPTDDSRERIDTFDAFRPPMRSTTSLLLATYFCHIMTFYFFMKWIPKIVSDMGYAPALAGGVLVWANVGGASGSVALGLLTRIIDVRRLVIVSMVCGAVSVAAFGQHLTNLPALSGAALIAGFFVNGATAGLYAVTAQAFPTHLRAGGTGIVIGAGRGGAALGPIIGGLLFSEGLPLAIVAPVMALGCVTAALLLSRVRSHQENPA